MLSRLLRTARTVATLPLSFPEIISQMEALQRENASLREEIEIERKYRTSGGRRPAVDKEWGNAPLPRPEHTNGF